MMRAEMYGGPSDGAVIQLGDRPQPPKFLDVDPAEPETCRADSTTRVEPVAVATSTYCLITYGGQPLLNGSGSVAYQYRT